MNFIALDLETTGLDPNIHGPISIGLFNSDINLGLDMNPGDVAYSYDATKVHGVSYEKIQELDPIVSVDLQIAELLDPIKKEKGPFVAVGFNVGAFDLTFLNKWMPNTAKMFHYRHFDLNTMFMTRYLDMENPELYSDAKSLWVDSALKDLEYDRRQLHNAYVDAKVAWNILQRHIDKMEGMEAVFV